MTGVAKGTVLRLLEDVGYACRQYHLEQVKGLSCNKIQCDEIWAFCYAKKKNVPEKFKEVEGYGDVWTWTALDADTKLMVSWMVGDRDANTAHAFMHDVKSRVTNRIQLTTDAHKPYLKAVESAFGDDIDYSMLRKIYKTTSLSTGRYSPPECVGTKKEIINGKPAEDSISTSFVERANLGMRMGMRRFTRLTNGFSKKVENLEAAVSLHFMYYNFCRVHKTLGTTPAVKAGISTTVWDLTVLLTLTKRYINVH
jgi:IS1 family transposase